MQQRGPASACRCACTSARTASCARTTTCTPWGTWISRGDFLAAIRVRPGACPVAAAMWPVARLLPLYSIPYPTQQTPAAASRRWSLLPASSRKKRRLTARRLNHLKAEFGLDIHEDGFECSASGPGALIDAGNPQSSSKRHWTPRRQSRRSITEFVDRPQFRAAVLRNGRLVLHRIFAILTPSATLRAMCGPYSNARRGTWRTAVGG